MISIMKKKHTGVRGGGGVNETPNYAVILVGIGLANKLKKKNTPPAQN